VRLVPPSKAIAPQPIVEVHEPALVQQTRDRLPGSGVEQQVVALGDDQGHVRRYQHAAHLGQLARAVEDGSEAALPAQPQPPQQVNESIGVEGIRSPLAFGPSELPQQGVGEVEAVHRHENRGVVAQPGHDSGCERGFPRAGRAGDAQHSAIVGAGTGRQYCGPRQQGRAVGDRRRHEAHAGTEQRRGTLVDMTGLSGASVIVTGASGALGSRIAIRLARGGANLTLSGRDLRRLTQVAAQVGGSAVLAPGDLIAPGTPADVVAAALSAHGLVDGVVHAAGVVAFGPLDDLDDDVLDELMLVNALAPIRLLRAALPHLRASSRSPFACHISAVVAERPLPGMAAYSASKAALTAFDAAMASELRRAGVRVIDVRPPHTETGLAGRAIAGSAPALPAGKDPDAVADRVMAAITGTEREVDSAAF